MGRTIAGVDFGALLPQVFDGLLEPLVLEHLGIPIEVQGFWERTGDATDAVLIANLGGLEGIQPLPNDVLVAGDQRAIVQQVQGIDEVVWTLSCSNAVSAIGRTPAPNITATRTSAGTGVQLTLDDPLPPNHSWRTKWRYGTATGWGNVAVTSQRVRHIAGLRADELVVVESIVLNGEAEASMPTYTPVEGTP